MKLTFSSYFSVNTSRKVSLAVEATESNNDRTPNINLPFVENQVSISPTFY